jgi:hypothetical protein
MTSLKSVIKGPKRKPACSQKKEEETPALLVLMREQGVHGMVISTPSILEYSYIYVCPKSNICIFN